jgi:MFS family permease
MSSDLVKIEYRGTYQAYINLFYGLGSASGAAFGGFLCDTLGWRWTFGIQVPPVLLILLFGILNVPSDLGPMLAKHTDESWYRIITGFDLAGSFLLTLATGTLMLGLNLGGNVLSWSHPFVISSLIVSVIAAILLVYVENRAHRPVLPLQFLSIPPRSNLVFSNFFAMIGINTVIFNAPLYFQAVKLDSASMSGFRLAVPAALLTVFAVSTGFFITWTGRLKAPQVLGGICMLVGAVALSSMYDGIPTWLVMVFVVPTSLGQGIFFLLPFLDCYSNATYQHSNSPQHQSRCSQSARRKIKPS